MCLLSVYVVSQLSTLVMKMLLSSYNLRSHFCRDFLYQEMFSLQNICVCFVSFLSCLLLSEFFFPKKKSYHFFFSLSQYCLTVCVIFFCEFVPSFFSHIKIFIKKKCFNHIRS